MKAEERDVKATSWEITNMENKYLQALCCNSFSELSELGYEHSLIDCDFKDSFRCYPEDVLTFYSQNNLSLDEFWKAYNFFCDSKTLVDQNPYIELKRQVLTQKIEFKKIKYTDVESYYFSVFPHGIVYLTGYSFRFYLAALISIVAKDNADDLGLALDFLISLLESSSDEKSCFSPTVETLSVEQKKTTALFLEYLSSFPNDEYFNAKKALEKYWGRYL